jgi:uncharacterized protein (DUF1778 family)
MGDPISIRLSDRERATIEQAARARGLGISAFIREVVEQEAIRLRRERIRDEGRKLVERLRQPDAAEYYDDSDLPAAEIVP